MGQPRRAQALDSRRDAATSRRQAGGRADRDDREGDPAVHRSAGRPARTRGLLRGRAGRVRADFARFSHPRELASWLGITPSEYSSGDQQHRGHITKAGNRHARRLLVEAAWHYRHPPRRPASGPQPDQRARQAQIRLHHRHRHLTEHGKRSTVVNVAVARELVAFIWAAMTDQPDRQEHAA